ncbi:CopD family protein, partial [Micromonospora sp. NPDC048999]|uniref:CopD family protein n=1 Tax=Micromonospora sp. NPDC048999 TaxID=3155391 RepID=UPI0033C2895A
TSLAGVFDPDLLGTTLSTRLGHALVARLVIVLALGVVFGIAVRPSPISDGVEASGATRRMVLPALATAGAVALMLTWTLADHAQTGVQTWLAVPVAGLHLLAMALWLGGLVLLVACVLVPGGGSVVSLEPVLPRFSRLAEICFAVIAVTGGYLAWRQVGSWAALGATVFGWLLLGKLAVVLVVVGLASGARRFVRRRGGGSLDARPSVAVRRLRRSVVGEVVLGVVVVSITAVLVNTVPARTSYAPPVHVTVPVPAGDGDGDGDGAGVGLRGGSVEVTIEPARSGSNVADIYLTGQDGSLVAVPEIFGELQSPDRTVTALPVKISAAEPGHYVANPMSVPFPGSWVLRLDIRISDFDETPVRVPFTAR